MFEGTEWIVPSLAEGRVISIGVGAMLLVGNKFQLHHYPQVETLLWLAGFL